jgi:hypothetical protein
MGCDASFHLALPFGKYSQNIREFFTNSLGSLRMDIKKVSIVDDEPFLSGPQCISADMQQF